jgi:methyl-accepting chemotaxis protein
MAIKGEAAISDPVASRSTGHLVTVVAAPVKSGNKVTAVLYGAIDMQGLTKEVLDVKIGKTGYVYVVRGDGMVIIHPNKDLPMKYNPTQDANAHPELVSATQRGVKGESAIVSYEFMGSRKMIAFAPIPERIGRRTRPARLKRRPKISSRCAIYRW